MTIYNLRFLIRACGLADFKSARARSGPGSPERDRAAPFFARGPGSYRQDKVLVHVLFGHVGSEVRRLQEAKEELVNQLREERSQRASYVCVAWRRVASAGGESDDLQMRPGGLQRGLVLLGVKLGSRGVGRGRKSPERVDGKLPGSKRSVSGARRRSGACAPSGAGGPPLSRVGLPAAMTFFLGVKRVVCKCPLWNQAKWKSGRTKRFSADNRPLAPNQSDATFSPGPIQRRTICNSES